MRYHHRSVTHSTHHRKTVHTMNKIRSAQFIVSINCFCRSGRMQFRSEGVPSRRATVWPTIKKTCPLEMCLLSNVRILDGHINTVVTLLHSVFLVVAWCPCTNSQKHIHWTKMKRTLVVKVNDAKQHFMIIRQCFAFLFAFVLPHTSSAAVHIFIWCLPIQFWLYRHFYIATSFTIHLHLHRACRVYLFLFGTFTLSKCLKLNMVWLSKRLYCDYKFREIKHATTATRTMRLSLRTFVFQLYCIKFSV